MIIIRLGIYLQINREKSLKPLLFCAIGKWAYPVRFSIWPWFGLVGLSFNASLEPPRKARKRARLSEDALAHNTSLGLGG